MVPTTGVEPACHFRPTDFKSGESGQLSDNTKSHVLETAFDQDIHNVVVKLLYF